MVKTTNKTSIIFIMLVLFVISSKAQKQEVFYQDVYSTEIRYDFFVHSTIEKVFGDTYYSLIIPRDEKYINEDIIYKCYSYNFVTTKTDSFNLIFKRMPDKIAKRHVGIIDFVFTKKEIYILAFSYILVCKQKRDGNYYYYRGIKTKENFTHFYNLASKNSFVASTYYQNKRDSVYDAYVHFYNLKRNDFIKTMSFDIDGIRFSFFNNVRVDFSNRYSAISDITKYEIVIIDNNKSSIIDTICLNEFSSGDNEKEFVSKANISRSRKENGKTPQIKKIAFINDSCLMVAKTDSLFYKNKRLFIDFWLCSDTGCSCYLSNYIVETDFSINGDSILNPNKPLLFSLLNSTDAVFYNSMLIYADGYSIYNDFKGMTNNEIIHEYKNIIPKERKQNLHLYHFPLP